MEEKIATEKATKQEKVGLEKTFPSRLTSSLGLFQFKSKDEIDDDEARFTDDCYSFIALGCGEDNRIPFVYGLLVFTVQITFLILMICSKVNRNMSANEDIDNPDEIGFAEYMPANASLVVRTTQFVSVIAFIVFAEDSISDVVDAVRYFPVPVWSMNHIFVTLACVLRFAQGMLACFTVFLLVMTSEDVIDIVLNFTAVNFISSMDNAAFELAKGGRYGPILKKQAEAIEEDIKVEHKCLLNSKDEIVITVDENGEEQEESVDVTYKWYLPTISLIAALLLGFCIYVARQQQRDGVWEARIFRVEFDEETGLLEYSGCYDDIGKNEDRRAIYKSKNYSKQEPAVLEYCKENRRWVFYSENDDEDVDRCHPGDNGLAQSTKTNSFSVTTAFELNWLSPYKKPLEVYFLEGDDKNQLFCSQFADDGRCDEKLNNFDYKFDGGDCCGTTCNHANCGTSEAIYAFNQELTDGAIGFPNCEDPEMDDLTVNLTMIEFQENENSGMWKDFWTPTLTLECGEDKSVVFLVPVSQSMFGYAYENIMVGSDSVCDLTASNFGPFFGPSFSLEEVVSFSGIESVNLRSKNSIPTDFYPLEGQSALVFGT